MSVDDSLQEERYKAIVKLLKKENLAAAIFTRLENVRYATDVRPIYSMFHLDQYIAVIKPHEPPVLISSEADRYYVNLELPWVKWLPLPSFVPRGTAEEIKAQRIAEALHELSTKKVRVGYDNLSIKLFQALRGLIKADLISIETEVLKLRAIKSSAEILIMERAARLAEIGMEAVRKALIPGKTETELATEAICAMRKAGAEAASHIPAIRSGENAERLYRVPTDRALSPGDPVIADLGARYQGYSAEYCRTMVLGQPKKDLKAMYKVLFAAYKRGIKMVKPGTLAQDIDHAIREAIVRAGFPEYPHATGHGIGMANAEYPPINQTSKAVLQEGMVICIEPGIYLPGVGAVKEEDVILVTRTGPRLLTKTPYEEKLLHQ